jgi:hypothetical protein
VARALRTRNLAGARQFRIVPSRYPPVDLFERIADAEELELVYEIESLTNDRLRAEAGDLYRVPREEWVTGPGATVVMAAFTHLGRPTRFGDGSYGVYYAALDEATAIAETRFHAERFLRQTREPPMELDRRCYVGRVEAPLEDIRGPAFAELRDPDVATWPRCQAFGAARRAAGASGLLYRSARRDKGECIAAFRPRAVSRPVQGRHLRYVWDGERITNVYALNEVRDG